MSCELAVIVVGGKQVRLPCDCFQLCNEATMSCIIRSITAARHLSRSTVAFTSQTSARTFCVSRTRQKDPWPLPGSPEHLASTVTPPDLPPPEPIPRPNESINAMRARLVYQSRKRGTLESDLLMSTFARDNLQAMSEEELREYDRFLDEPDWDIYYWATGKRAPPERWQGTQLLEKLAKHARNEGRNVRRMPPLSE
jgi:succinate dehydrogenase assembly factor 2